MMTNRSACRWRAAGVGVALLLGIAACSSGQAASGATGTSCGSTRTGANVPVVIKVVKGTVDCGSVLSVENSYAALIKNNDVPGNGGGAPVKVSGWTCQGYPTPEVLRTGYASQCHTGSAEVVAVLALPSAGSTGGTGPTSGTGPAASTGSATPTGSTTPPGSTASAGG